MRYYTGIHDANRKPDAHGKMQRRLQAYEQKDVRTFSIPLRYDDAGRGKEKGVDVRVAIDLTRMGNKGLYDVAVVVSEDSDLNQAIQDVYGLRDGERWIAVENALPWTPNSHCRWLTAAPRKRPIDKAMFDRVRDGRSY